MKPPAITDKQLLELAHHRDPNTLIPAMIDNGAYDPKLIKTLTGQPHEDARREWVEKEYGITIK